MHQISLLTKKPILTKSLVKLIKQSFDCKLSLKNSPDQLTIALEQSKYRFDAIILTDEFELKLIFKLVKKINFQARSTRVFFLLTKVSNLNLQNKIQALSFGADECLEFPFDNQEFKLRLQKLLFMQKISPEFFLEINGVKLYPHKGIATDQNRLLDFRKREFQILLLLFEHQGGLVTREMIIDRIWPDEVPLFDTIDSYVFRIRKILGRKKKIVKTVHGFGYMIINK